MKKSKVWFITGSSRGFGFEIAKAALAAGDSVVATVRKEKELLESKLGGGERLLVVPMELTDEVRVKGRVEAAIGRFGRIDVLVNNAGHGILSAVEEASDEEVRKNYDTNVFGLLNVTRAVLPHMRKERSGHVINISSVGGLTGIVGWGLYGSTKFAVEGITEALAAEVAPLGIYATVVEPGFFRTDFLEATSLVRAAGEIGDYAQTVGSMRGYAMQVNRKQPGDPVKLARAILQLADSDKPPVHLPLGKDTLEFFQGKMDRFNADIAAWRAVIVGTDHADVGIVG